MTAKQIPGSIYAPDGSLYITLTDGAGNLASASGAPGGSTTQVQYNNAGSFGGISGATTNGTVLTLTTPALGVASATSINKLTITAPATSAVLTIANGKTLTASNTLTLTATDGSTLAIGAGGTLGTAAYVATGTSGATIPLLNAANNIWSGKQTVNVADSSIGVLVAGTSKGIRFIPVSTEAQLAGVDNTGNASYQPLGVYGSVLNLGHSGTIDWTINASGNFVAGTDNTNDIGASGATRPRQLFMGPSTTAHANINLPATGVAPTSPTNGDIWFDGTNLKIQIGGSTKTVTVS